MKTLLHITGCLAAVFAVASCAKEAAEAASAAEGTLVPVTIQASVPAATRTDLDGTTPVWLDGDAIGVFTSDGTLCPQAFTTDDDYSPSATFSGMKPEYSRLSMAFYPYSADAGVDGDVLTLNLPRQQGGTPADAVMVSLGNEQNGFTFENVCCLVKMNIPSSLSVRQVEIVRNDQVSGPFTVDTSDSPFPVEGLSDLSDHQDRRAWVKTSYNLSGTVFLSVLPSSSTRLEMALTNASGKVGFIATDFRTGIPYEAGRIKNLGTIPAGTVFQDAALVANPTATQL